MRERPTGFVHCHPQNIGGGNPLRKDEISSWKLLEQWTTVQAMLCTSAEQQQLWGASLHTHLLSLGFFLSIFPSCVVSLHAVSLLSLLSHFKRVQISLENGSEYQIGISYLTWQKKSLKDEGAAKYHLQTTQEGSLLFIINNISLAYNGRNSSKSSVTILFWLPSVSYTIHWGEGHQGKSKKW